MSPVVGTHTSLVRDWLRLQGLGSQCFPAPRAGSTIIWWRKKRFCRASSVPGDPPGVPYPMGTCGSYRIYALTIHPWRTPSPPISTPWASCPHKHCWHHPWPSPTGVSSTLRCSHDEDTSALEDVILRETQLATSSTVWPNLGESHPAPTSSSGLPHMSSALSSSYHGWVTPALLCWEGPLPLLGAAPGTRALQEHGMGGDTLPVPLSPGVRWGHPGVVHMP